MIAAGSEGAGSANAAPANAASTPPAARASVAPGRGPAPAKRPAFEPAERLLTPTRFDPDMPRPTSTVAGAVLVLLGVLAQAFVLAGLATGWDHLIDGLDGRDGIELSGDVEQFSLWLVLGGSGVVLLFELVLAIFIYRGRNWPRVIVMILTAISISSSFVAWWVQGQEITLHGTFLSLCLDILVLLALSSRSAAAYARRNERR